MLVTSMILSLATQGNLHDIIKLCKQDLLDEAVKEKGGNSLLRRTKAARKMLYALEEYRITTYGASIQNINGEDLQCFTNGYYAFMLKQPLEGLLEAGEKPFKMDKLLNFDNRLKTEINIAEIKAYVKIYKAETKEIKSASKYPPFDVGTVRYNAQYILDCYEILGGDIEFYQDEYTPLQHAILESENGYAVLTPIRK